jgi:hypothetical protein
MTESIDVADLEAAINHWRALAPATDGFTLTEPVRALAEVYGAAALWGWQQVDAALLSPPAWQAWLDWYATTPDTPCIGICSTAQGDAVCKGCGRSFAEVQDWTQMHPLHKRVTWLRIQREGVAWCFNRYAERATPKEKATPKTEVAKRLAGALARNYSEMPPETSITSPLM